MFNKKNKVKDNLETDGVDTKGTATQKYRIQIYKKIGNLPKKTTHFMVNEIEDKENFIVYLQSANPKIKFLELSPTFPRDSINLTETQLKTRITKLKTQLKKEDEKDDPDVNDWDLEYDLLKYEAQLRHLSFSHKRSFIELGEDGVPEINYLREGSNYHLMSFDLESKTIAVVGDETKKSANILLRNKNAKYQLKDKVTPVGIILCIVGVIMVFGNIYGGYQMWGNYDKSELADAQRAALEVTNKINEELLTSAREIKGMAEKVDSMADNNPTINIEGLVPE
jgi:hypothetical protein